MPYIEIRMEYDSWCKEHGLDTQAFVDRMLGECIRTEQENEAKAVKRDMEEAEKAARAEKAKAQEFKPVKAEIPEPKGKVGVIPDIIPIEALEGKPSARKKKGKKA